MREGLIIPRELLEQVVVDKKTTYCYEDVDEYYCNYCDQEHEWDDTTNDWFPLPHLEECPIYQLKQILAGGR